MWPGEAMGQGWPQVGELALAFLLSALIGLEREIRQKSAGLRTHTLVGLAAALIMLISKYGFTDILANNRVVVDPSRVAAQVVSGIGFIGGGLIFVRRDNVRGLTTAAIVWMTAAVGMACGAGLPVLALVVAAGHFIVVFTFPHLVGHLPKSRWTPSVLQVSYEDGREILRDVLVVCTQHDFAVSRLRVERTPAPGDASIAGALREAGEAMEGDQPMPSDIGERPGRPSSPRIATVVLVIQGVRSVSKLAAKLAEIDGVVSVHAGDSNVPTD
jgi:putative Mg2+ transporter-C (MgtC) family protein